MRVSVDAMGGDHAPRVVVEGAAAAVREAGLSVTLVGRPEALRDEIDRLPDAGALGLSIVPASDVIEMGEPPARSLRRKPDASIRVAADLLARGEAGALFSAGNTGAIVLAARSALGLLKGAERPALATPIPTMRGTAVLLDIGANADCRPQHLVTFAVMGAVYAKVGLGHECPRVGLLSIGEEEGKGNELTREAHRRLRDSSLQFVGNLEARDIYSGQADVVVCDGFTGNVVVKVSESLVEMVEAVLRRALDAAGGAGAAGNADAVEHFCRHVDYSEYGGALLLGVAGPCVVGHGRSSVKAVRNAIVLASRVAADQLVSRVEGQLVGFRGSPS
ncbi:MAG: phosphate acyltransferase PlsX [Acidobacteriota bacterium]